MRIYIHTHARLPTSTYLYAYTKHTHTHPHAHSTTNIRLTPNFLALCFLCEFDAPGLWPCVRDKFVFIYIYILYVLFRPLKPESGIIPPGQKKSFNYEHLNFPSKELNVTDITEQ